MNNFLTLKPTSWSLVEYGRLGFISDRELINLPDIEGLLIDYMLDWLEGLPDVYWETCHNLSRRGVDYYFLGETWKPNE